MKINNIFVSNLGSKPLFESGDCATVKNADRCIGAQLKLNE